METYDAVLEDGLAGFDEAAQAIRIYAAAARARRDASAAIAASVGVAAAAQGAGAVATHRTRLQSAVGEDAEDLGDCMLGAPRPRQMAAAASLCLSSAVCPSAAEDPAAAQAAVGFG